MSSEGYRFKRQVRGMRRGVLVTHTLLPSKFKCSRLVSELADLWIYAAKIDGLSINTSAGHRSSIVSFCKYVDTRPGTQHESIYGENSTLAFIAYGWRTAMGGVDGVTPATRHRAYSQVLNLIGRAGAMGQPVNALLLGLANGHSSTSRDDSTPLDEYANPERLRQMRVATADAARTENRLRRGEALYRDDEAFRKLVDSTFAGAPVSEIRAAVATDAALKAAISMALTGHDSSGPLVKQADSWTPSKGEIASLIAPSGLELLSFQILLLWATGIAPEQVRDTKIHDLDFYEAGMTWTTFKARAGRLMNLNFEDKASLEPWGTVGLFRRAICATSLARDLKEDDPTLWINWTIWRGVVRLRPQNTQKPNLSHWVAAHEIESSSPVDLRRIRKAVKAVRAGISGSSKEAAGPDHSEATFNRHYLPVTSVISRSARTVAHAQESVFEQAISTSPLVVAQLSESIANDPSASDALRHLAFEVDSESMDERALGVSACANPTDSPFSDPGVMCMERPFSCLGCPNAVIFLDHLPQILIMEEVIEQERLVLYPPVFIERWSQKSRVLDGVLEQFSPGEIESARVAIGNKSGQLHLPLASRSVLDL